MMVEGGVGEGWRCSRCGKEEGRPEHEERREVATLGLQARTAVRGVGTVWTCIAESTL